MRDRTGRDVVGVAVAVYMGTAIGEPKPADLPAVLLLRPELGRDILHGEWSVQTRQSVPLQALIQSRGTMAVLRDVAIDYPHAVGRMLTLTT